MKKISILLITFIIMSVSSGVHADFVSFSKEIMSSAGGPVVEGDDGWLYLTEEFAHIGGGVFWGDKAASVSRTTKKEFADPLPAIIDFNEQLKALGIELIMVPVPPKAVIYPEFIPGYGEKSSSESIELHSSFYKLLGEKGVNVVDITEQFVDAAKKEQLYCKTDTHISGAGIASLSEAIAKKIVGQSWYEVVEKRNFFLEQRSLTITGDLSQMLIQQKGKKGPDEDVLLNYVNNAEGGLVLRDDQSPVLLMGDSHTLVFSVGGDMHAKGAGLAEMLSSNLGIAVDVIGVRGSGATPARIKLYQKGRKDSSYLAGKKVVVWCFTAREFTGSGGWRKVPVIKK